MSGHPSNCITLANLQHVVYPHRLDAGAVEKMNRVAAACEKAMRAHLESDRTVESYNPVHAVVQEYQRTIEECVPDCRDKQEAIDAFYQLECPFEGQCDENFQEDLHTLRLIRIWANAAIALDPASALSIDLSRGEGQAP